jgi:cobalt-zinc-cadmium efflux system membrane fusion protein
VDRDVRALGPLLALGLAACVPRGDDEARPVVAARSEAVGTLRLSAAARAALDLRVDPAAEGALPDTALRFGRVQARLGDETVVVAPVTGRVSVAPGVSLGARVEAGQVLLSLAPVLSAAERMSFRVQGAELAGRVEVAARELADRESAAARARALAPDAVVSRARLQEAETAVAVARAQVAAATQARSAATGGAGAGAVPLCAPGAGTLVSLTVTVGTLVPAGATLARIVRAGPRWIDLSVPPDDASGAGYEVAADGRWLAARLLARGGAVEDDGARHDRLEVEADDLLPGAVVSVRVARGPSEGVVVPEEAVAPGVGGDVVYVEEAAGEFAARPVRVAARFAGRVRLASGVRAGEPVVVRGAAALRSEALRGALGEGD